MVSDLFEGGHREELLRRMRQLTDSRVKILCLLALSDGGAPSYNHELAHELSALSIPCFGCTPKLLVDVVERIFKRQDPSSLVMDALSAHRAKEKSG